MAARALNAGFNLVSVPIFLSLLGPLGYGAIVSALVVHGAMSLSDIGTGEVVQRQMSLALAAKDEDEIRELNRDQLGINLLTGLLMILVGVLCGLFIPLERTSPAESFWMFAALGVQSAFFRVNQSLSTLLGVFQRFDFISIATALGGLATTGIAIGLAFWTLQAWSYVVAMLIGESLIFAVQLKAARSVRSWAFAWPTLNWSRIKPILKLCAVDYPNRAASYFAAWGDKLVLMGSRNTLPLVDFRNASRFPDALRDMLTPLATTSLPKLSRDYQRSFKEFQESTLFSSMVVLFASSLILIVPAGFADPVLRLWLGEFFPHGGGRVFLLMGIYQALQMYLSVMGFAFFSAAKRQWFIPLTAVNAVASIFLTLPLFSAYGIVGIGWLKVCLGAAQVAGLWVILLQLGFEKREVWRHALKVLALLGVVLVFVAGGDVISSTPLIREASWLAVLLAPLMCLLAMALILKLRLAHLPARLSERLAGIPAKFLKRGSELLPPPEDSRPTL